MPETVEDAWGEGADSSIAIDSSDKVHISYTVFDGESEYWMTYATKVFGFWVNTYITWMGGYTSIATDSSDNVHISFARFDNWGGGLGYATCSSSSDCTQTDNWNIELVDTEGTDCSIAMDSSDNVHISYYDSANRDLKYAKIPSAYTLTVNKAGSGSGTVTADPSGIDCGTDCTEDYSYGTVVTLTTTPTPGSTFAGWSGDPDCSNGEVTMDADKTCTATFNLLTYYTLTVTKEGTGSGKVISMLPGINCGTDCSEDYRSGTLVILIATPDDGSVFAGWSGDPDCSNGKVTMDADKTCTATFNLLTYTLTVTKEGSGSGLVRSDPAGIDCGTDCSEDYPGGTLVNLGARPDKDSTFVGWSGDPSCSEKVIMDADKTCTATFNLKTYYTLTVTKEGSGSGLVRSGPEGIYCGTDCSEDYTSGTLVDLKAYPDDDSTFVGWSGDPDCSDGEVTMDADKTCTATFDLTTFDPVPDIKANGSDGPVKISSSDILSITVELAAGSRAGENADWWVVVYTPFPPPDDWYYYDVNSDTWNPGFVATYQGLLFDLSTYEVLNMSGLPVGSYTFYFGVDMIMNGSLDMDQAFYDSVEVTITP
jgi:hypothetical protein